MRGLPSIFCLFIFFLTGCVSSPEFEATVVSSETGGGGPREVNLPEEWRKSVDPVPYFPPLPEAEVKILEENSEMEEPANAIEGVGRGAIVSKIDQPPYGTPVPGKSNLVRSPFSDQGFVDVSGYPPETEVKCPYTSKVFLVP